MTSPVTLPPNMPLQSVRFLPSTSLAALIRAWVMGITSKLVTHIHSCIPAVCSPVTFFGCMRHPVPPLLKTIQGLNPQ